VSAVLLDVGGVFLLPDPVMVGQALGVAVTAETVTRGHYAGIAALDVDPVFEWARYHAALAEQCGVRPGPELADLFRTAMPWRMVVPGAVQALRAIAAAGFSLGVVSNADGTIAEQLLAAEVCQVGEGAHVPVAVVMDSAVFGAAKPDPAIFHAALDALGVQPEEAVHVGDSLQADVTGAAATGIRPLHLDPFGLCPGPDGHEHVRSLSEVLARIGE
jgi:putative hydrolase of the HAD superfamily